MDLLAIGGLTFDHMFKVVSLPTTHFATTITRTGIFYGGRAPNVAVMVAALGLKTGIVSLVGEDFSGSGYRNHLQKLCVDLRGVVEVPRKETTKTFIFTDKNEKQITFVCPGVSTCLSGMEPPAELIKESAIVHISSCNNLEFEVDAARAARRTKALVSYDPGNQPIKSEEHLNKLITNASFLFLNNVETSVIIKKLNITNIREIPKLGPRIVVVINKKDKSSIIYTSNGIEKIPSVQKCLKYPTGTSDGYIAGFLTGYLKGYDLKTMGLLGAVEASIVGESFGCQTKLPSWNQLITKM